MSRTKQYNDYTGPGFTSFKNSEYFVGSEKSSLGTNRLSKKAVAALHPLTKALYIALLLILDVVFVYLAILPYKAKLWQDGLWSILPLLFFPYLAFVTIAGSIPGIIFLVKNMHRNGGKGR